MSRQQKVKILVKQPYGEIEEVYVEPSLGSLQDLVGGLIEFVPFPGIKGVDIMLNEEGKIHGMKGNFFIPHYDDCIVGPAVILAHDRNKDKYLDLTDTQIKKVKDYIKTFQLEEGQELYRDYHVLRPIIKTRQKAFDKQSKEAQAA